MPNFGGIKIHPEDIDLVLERHNNIFESCTIGIEHPVHGETAVSIISLRDSENINNKNELLEFVSKRYRSDSLPTKFFVTKSIPKNERGKIDRKLVKSELLKGNFLEIYE